MMKSFFSRLICGSLIIGLAAQAQELRLNLSQALELALMNNPELRSQRLDLEIAKVSIDQVKANYDPYIQLETNYSEAKRPTTEPAFGNESKTSAANLAAGANTPTGGNVSLSWQSLRQESNSEFAALNPGYSSDLVLNLFQPLLKNGLDWRASQLREKMNEYQRAEISLKSKALEIASRIEDAYWSLVRARMNLEVSQKSVERGQTQYDTTQAQFRAGTAAELSLLQAQANLESARVELIRNEAEAVRAGNYLKQLLYFESEDELLKTRIIPSDAPQAEEYKIDPQSFVNEALAKSYTLESLRLNLQNLKLHQSRSKNQLLPQLDFNAGLTLYGLAGRSQQSALTGESDLEGNYWDAADMMLEGENLGWQTGLSFKIPVGNRSARSQWRIAQYNYQKAELEIERQRRAMRFNLESLLTDLASAYKGWQSAKLARELADKSYQIEKKKFQLGMSTPYQLLDQERSLKEAERNEVWALIEYNKAIGRIKRGQEGYIEAGGVFNPGSAGAGWLSGTGYGMVPSGVDLNLLRSLGLNLP